MEIIHTSQPESRISFKSNQETNNPSIQPSKPYKWWLQLFVYTLFVLFGQSGATLLRRLYYEKGGKSIWLASLLETIGFPILIPFSFNFKKTGNSINGINKHSSIRTITLLLTSYICLGLLQAINNMLYSVGLLYLPVSTFSLLSASELFFTAFFSLLINKQKLTPPIINSLVLLIASSTILIIHGDNNNNNNSERRHTRGSRDYAVGFSSTIIASAVYSLQLSLTQLFFQKVSGSVNFTTVMNMLFNQSLVASCFGAIAIVAVGEGKGLKGEMERFELGKLGYWLILIGIVVAWQAFAVGAVGLIFRVSSLFSNVIGALALPIIPILAAVFFREEMDGLKVITMLLALWGVVSYVYQHYLDDCKRRLSDVSGAGGIVLEKDKERER
ncbi:purine permease 21-like [Impatiens glandulifera]|uniref:purine permease 21-like n=1 Tax=Impatiens glandulifera TaxID=253017 RepID=UPI001FB155AD|nr:purine permease 21-like [Impatiens glandulifera]